MIGGGGAGIAIEKSRIAIDFFENSCIIEDTNAADDIAFFLF